MDLMSPRIFLKLLEKTKLDEEGIDKFYKSYYYVFDNDLSFEFFCKIYIEYLLINLKFAEFKRVFNYDFIGLDDYLNLVHHYLCYKYGLELMQGREVNPEEILRRKTFYDNLEMEFNNNFNMNNESEEMEFFQDFIIVGNTPEQVLMLNDKKIYEVFLFIFENSPNKKLFSDIFKIVFWKIFDEARKNFKRGA